MDDLSRRLITLRIRAKARHQRYASIHHRHDPEPQTPDVLTTVSVADHPALARHPSC